MKSQFPGVDTAISGYRYYNPSLGRFVGRDRIAENGGRNLYGFCGNNGVNSFDVLGMYGDGGYDPNEIIEALFYWFQTPVRMTRKAYDEGRSLMAKYNGGADAGSWSSSVGGLATMGSLMYANGVGSWEPYHGGYIQPDGSLGWKNPNSTGSSGVVDHYFGYESSSQSADRESKEEAAKKAPPPPPPPDDKIVSDIPLATGGKLTTASGIVITKLPPDATATDAPNNAAPAATSGNGGSVLGSLVSGALGLVGKVWNLPNTVIGVTAGLVGWALGGDAPTISNNAIVFANNPLASAGAITLGNAILIGAPTKDNPDWGPNFVLPNGYTVLQHEEQHTYQGQLLGPLYLPANGLAAAISVATAPPGTYDKWHYNNFMENGPQSSPPAPCP